MASSRVRGLRLRIATRCAEQYGVPFAAVSIDDHAIEGAPKDTRWCASVVIKSARVPGLATTGPNASSVLKSLASKLKLD
jgi:D-aminopeptidase